MFLLDLSAGGDEGGTPAGSLGGTGTSGRLSFVACEEAEGPTGSLAGTDRESGSEKVPRRGLGNSEVEPSSSLAADVDCEREDGPAGSLAGIVGNSSGPADCDRARGFFALSAGTFAAG